MGTFEFDAATALSGEGPVFGAVLEIGVASTTVELTVHLRARPAPGWLAFRTLTRYLEGGYFDEDAEIWDSAGRLVAQSRQLALVLR